ncbi:MAG: monofunctional biosynthetic peptidoglycan transglycosylase, partial [Bacteroidetes bacterium]|nr:monofunctional biosynthetic peptidoglycan transglycosylase [Bacteroidota bacterium]
MKPGLLKLIWRIAKLALILFFGLSILWVILYRFVNPP